MITDTTIQNIRDAARIEDVVRDAIPDLKKAGSGYRACCPFHAEKTPSFHVNPARGIFKCFGCGKSGDAITFVMESRNLTYPDAIEHLAGKYGIEVERTTQPKNDPAFSARQQVNATLTALQAHFSLSKDAASDPGRDYWRKRGYKDEILDLYGIGYCPAVSAPPITPEALQAAGVANEKGNLTHYKRSTIPLHDHRGNLVSVVGRSIADDAKKGDKYLNGRTVEGVYEKGKFLFNLCRADKSIRTGGEIWIVEGYADSMALTQMGKQNNIALCGVALTDEHVRTLKGYNGTRPLRFFLALDAQTNPSGADYRPEVEKALWKAVSALLPIGEVRIVLWPLGCKDAGEMVQRGISAELLKTEESIEYFIRVYCTKDWKEQASPVQKAEMQDTVAAMIALVGKDNARDIYINTLSNNLEINPRRLEELVKKFRSQKETEETDRRTQEWTYIKVLDDYLERQVKPDLNSEGMSVVYVQRKVAELKLEKGLSFVRSIPRFHNWITDPSHTNYQRIIEHPYEGQTFRFFNRYQPLPHKPKEFAIPETFTTDPAGFDYEQIPEIKHVARFFKHIFGYDEYRNRFVNIGWDWFALCYLRPKQRLPALALVSTDEGTGKSTFINLALKLFGQNATKTDAARISGNFNAQMSGRVFIGVEETKDEKGKIENILKDWITGFEMTVERKHKDAETEEAFCKFCFASNHEDSFMKVGTGTTRFFVMRVDAIKEKDPAFEDKLYREIPYLMYFLQKRGILYNDGKPKDRLFFEPADYENEALLKLRQASKDVVQQNMEEMINMLFLRCEMPAPFIRLNSEYLKVLMQAYGGKLYEQKTPNYFQKVAVADMRCVYRDKPTSFELPELTGINNASWVTAHTWEYTTIRTKGRFVEFPIWKFCTPSEVVENITPIRVKLIQQAFLDQAEYLKITYGIEYENWLEKLNSCMIDAARMGQLSQPITTNSSEDDEDIPF